MILSRRELVTTFFAVEINGKIQYQIGYAEWDYIDKEVIKQYATLSCSKKKDIEYMVDTFCSNMGTKTIILIGFYDEGNVDYFPRTLTTKYKVYNYLNSKDKLVPVK